MRYIFTLLIMIYFSGTCLAMDKLKETTEFKISNRYDLSDSERITLEIKANAGDLTAAKRLEKYYLYCSCSPGSSIKWLKKNAEAECVSSIFMLGIYYCQEKKINEGLSLIKKAVNADYPPALYFLAQWYQSGYHFEKNEKKAFSMLMKAGLQGDFDSMDKLIECYSNGIGTSHNLRNAYLWTMIRLAYTLPNYSEYEPDKEKCTKIKNDLMNKINQEEQNKAMEEYNSLIKVINENKKKAEKIENCIQ